MCYVLFVERNIVTGRDENGSIDRHYDHCKCGKLKGKYGSTCSSCDQEQRKITQKRYDLCDCGKKKRSASKQCLKCHNKTRKLEELANDQRCMCSCGNQKSITSATCRDCYYKYKAKKKTPAVCACGNRKSPYSKRCIDCCQTVAAARINGLILICRGCKREICEVEKSPTRHYCIMCYPKILLNERTHRLKHVYGMTVNDYESMIQSQEWKCAICKRDIAKFAKDTHIDHCHTTHVIRGLLCNLCNYALGCLNDNVDIANNLIKYLTSPSAWLGRCLPEKSPARRKRGKSKPGRQQ